MTVKQFSGLCLREAGRGFIVSLKASNRCSASCLESLERTIALAAVFRKSAAGRPYGGVKGVGKPYHWGGGIVYHRPDDRGRHGRWSRAHLEAREDSVRAS